MRASVSFANGLEVNSSRIISSTYLICPVYQVIGYKLTDRLGIVAHEAVASLDSRHVHLGPKPLGGAHEVLAEDARDRRPQSALLHRRRDRGSKDHHRAIR